MTTQSTTAMETVVACIRSGDFEPLREVLTEDTLLDASVPGWRFQRKGADDIIAQFRDWYPQAPASVTPKHTPTEWGCVVEAEETREDGGQSLYFRYVFLGFESGGRLSRLTFYCSGGWDEETVARQKREAPMYEW